MKTLKIIFVFFVVMSILSVSVMQIQGGERKSRYGSSQININTANVEQLSKLPGIGKKKANRIISFRKKHGKFKRTQEIMKVKGIGEKTFKKFAKRIRV